MTQEASRLQRCQPRHLLNPAILRERAGATGGRRSVLGHQEGEWPLPLFCRSAALTVLPQVASSALAIPWPGLLICVKDRSATLLNPCRPTLFAFGQWKSLLVGQDLEDWPGLGMRALAAEFTQGIEFQLFYAP